MRIFKGNLKLHKKVCPICGTDKEGETTLIPILGTQDGNNIEAEQIHIECINPVYDKDVGVLYQKL